MGVSFPKTLHNFNVFIGDGNLAGIATEVVLPKIDIKLEGMYASMFTEFPVYTGELTPLQCTIRMAEYSAAMQFLVGKFPAQIPVTVKGSIGDDRSAQEIPVTAIITGIIMSYTPSAFASGKNTDDTYTVTGSYYKLIYNGQTVVEINFAKNVLKLSGKDVVEEIRKRILV